MKATLVCPVTDKSINERVARVNALFTFLTLILFGITENIWFIVFLGFDFYLRAWNLSSYSPFAIVSKEVVKLMRWNNIIMNAGPKIFAARIGLIFCLLIAATFLMNLHSLALGLAVILGLFSFLESIFGICVACILYPYLYNLLNGSRS